MNTLQFVCMSGSVGAALVLVVRQNKPWWAVAALLAGAAGWYLASYYEELHAAIRAAA
ncbi:MAG: hypothetical protein PHQ60_02315 [Sideroxydans sp.]|nr:hypothetical protein [Sideroxydans sp.]MDD5056678.1 hypothetical protein [Sideroxydans sp.]